MASNFLGDVHAGGTQRPSSIMSSAELIAREGVELTRSMNFRDGENRLSVFLVLPKEDGFHDEWREAAQQYVFEGHDSTTIDDGKARDQLLMYPSGKLTENGKFFKAANLFKDGARKEPLQIQVYEKLDAGVWYDKGMFNLVDAKFEAIGKRNVYKFYLELADAEFYGPHDSDKEERMRSAGEKVVIWKNSRGRCTECRAQEGLRIVEVSGRGLELRCALHGGKRGSGLLG